jgi:hypothetical protein
MMDGPIRNLIADDPTDCEGDFDNILELGVEPNSTLQN